MVSIATKNLFQEKTRLGISIGGVAFAVVLVVSVVGMYYAFDAAVTDVILNTGADVWVSSGASGGSMHGQSLLSPDLAENLRHISGVENVWGFVFTNISVPIDDRRYLLLLAGFDVESGMGGPWKMYGGSSRPSRGEIIIDRVFAAKTGLEVGENFELLDHEFKIVGISNGTNLFVYYMVFVPLEDAVALMPGEMVSHFLVKVDGSAPAEQVAVAIEENITGITALTSENLANTSKGEILGGFIPIILVIVAVGLLVGVSVVGLTVYTLTVERSKEYGILKAIGASNRRLYGIVAQQAIILSILGFVLGGILSGFVIYLAGVLVPEFVILVTIPMLMWVFSLFIVAGIIAAYLPARKVAGVDPATVFKA